jgi:chromosome partitioning protein
VGKTTVAANLAAAFARQGSRVLLLDTDSQGSATATMLESLPPEHPTMAHVFAGLAPLAEVLLPATREQITVAPASPDITGAIMGLVAKTGRETVLRRALRDVTGRFDLAIIDTAPEQQLGTVNALVAATHVLLPFTPDVKALEGLGTVAKAVHEIRQAELGDAELLGCVQVAFDSRMAISNESRNQVRLAYGPLLLDTVIRVNARFFLCPAWHRDIYEIERCDRDSRLRGSLDFDHLAAEVNERLRPHQRASAAA